MKTTVIEGQTLFDIALFNTGKTEGAFEIARTNGISVTDLLNEGSALELSPVLDSNVVKQLALSPVTTTTEDEYEDADFSHCIGYMILGEKVDKTYSTEERYPYETEETDSSISLESIFKIL